MSLNPGMLQTIRMGHDRMQELADGILSPSVKEKQQREMYRDLRREITLHALLAEEEDFRSIATQPKLATPFRALRLQVIQLEGFVNKLDARAMGTPSWREAMEQLRVLIGEHKALEESTLSAAGRGAAA